jgi:hypothetical protein
MASLPGSIGHVGPAFWIGLALLGCGSLAASGQTIPPAPVTLRYPIPDLNPRRILGVIPNYQTVSDPDHKVLPLTVRQKWGLALKESVDPFNLGNIILGASTSQWGNRTPKYGEGAGAYSERFGAAWADMATQNFFSAGVLASVLHQDPRYFRRGPRSGVLARVGYSLSRVVVARQDSGASAFNASGIGGMLLGIAASNAYCPTASVHGRVMASRISTSVTGSITGNLLAEFWPDVHNLLFRHKPLTAGQPSLHAGGGIRRCARGSQSGRVPQERGRKD